MKEHGILAVAPDLKTAFYLADLVEDTAKIAFIAQRNIEDGVTVKFDMEVHHDMISVQTKGSLHSQDHEGMGPGWSGTAPAGGKTRSGTGACRGPGAD